MIDCSGARGCSRRAENVDFSIFSSGCKQANLSTYIFTLQSYKIFPTPQNPPPPLRAGFPACAVYREIFIRLGV